MEGFQKPTDFTAANA